MPKHLFFMAIPKLMCRHHASISGEMCYMLQAESPTSKNEALTPPTIMLAAKKAASLKRAVHRVIGRRRNVVDAETSKMFLTASE
jgi:hypothetical protein